MITNNISNSSIVKSKRVLYTPTEFAKSSLLYLQEVGYLRALHAHTSKRNGIDSFLFFIVVDGCGTLEYGGEIYSLREGDCVFIDCRKQYSHSTDLKLWKLQWCHFNGISMEAIYQKYLDRGGKNVFHPDNIDAFENVLSSLYSISNTDDYVRDMRINEQLSVLLTLLMKYSWPESAGDSSKKSNRLSDIKAYLDMHYCEDITLDGLSRMFYIDKYYLSKIFKEAYGVTILSYITNKKITEAKQYLRFTDMSLDEISRKVGMNGSNYFCRVFKKVEGITPGEYRKDW